MRSKEATINGSVGGWRGAFVAEDDAQPQVDYHEEVAWAYLETGHLFVDILNFSTEIDGLKGREGQLAHKSNVNRQVSSFPVK